MEVKTKIQREIDKKYFLSFRFLYLLKPSLMDVPSSCILPLVLFGPMRTGSLVQIISADN